MATLGDIPIPRGSKALHEAVLLGRALINLFPDALERIILADEAWTAQGIPRTRVSVHVVYVEQEKRVGEDYILLDAHGGGKHDHKHDPSLGSVYELNVDLRRHPAAERFTRLHNHLQEQLEQALAIQRAGGRSPEPVTISWWEFVDAAYRTCTRLRPDEARPALVQLSDRLISEIGSVPSYAAEAINGITSRLPQLADDLRRRGNLDVWENSALLVAGYVPKRVAQLSTGEDKVQQLARYMTFSLLEMKVSPWQAVNGVARKALREGEMQALEQAADDMLSDAEQHRDRALDGSLDRNLFSEQLFLGTPKAWTAMQIYELLREMSPGSETVIRQKRHTTAEELAVRMQDGVAYQWVDFDDARIAEEWEKVQEARRARDNFAVQEILLQGELRLFRPRAARKLLLGPSRWPDRRAR